MNKKFYTLVAGLLLAGSAFSNAWAEKLSAAQKGVYYKLERVAEHDASWAKGAQAYVVSKGDVYGIATSGADYWKIVNNNDNSYSFVNLEGKTLKVGEQTKFTFTDRDTQVENVPFTQVYFSGKGTISIGQEQEDTDNDGIYALVARDDKNYKGVKGEGFDAVATSLREVYGNAFANGAKGVFVYTNEKGDQVIVGTSDKNDADIWTVSVNGEVFSFTNNETTPAKLKVDGYESFKIAQKVGSGCLFQVDGVEKYLSVKEGKFVTVDSKENATLFALQDAATTALSAAQLNYYEKNGFSVTIKHEDTNGKFTKTDIKDNFFTGHLTPMKWDATNKKFVAAASEDKYYLKNADGKYIVALADLAEGNFQSAYQFVTVSEDALKRDILKEGKHNYFGQYTFYYSENTNNVEAIELIDHIEVFDKDGSYKGIVGRLDFKKEAYLAVEPVYFTGNPIYLKPIQIKLGSDQVVDWKKFLQKGKYAQVQILSGDDKGKFVGINAVGTKEANVKSADNQLELQWAVTYNTASGEYTLTNRENTEVTSEIIKNGKTLYAGAKANQYKIGDLTLEIKFVDGASTDGYKTLDPIALKNQQYYVGVYSPIWKGEAWLTENHKKNHTIGLDTEKENANLWVITPNIKAREAKEDASYKDYFVPSDSVYVVSTIGYYDTDDKIYTTEKDTLKIPTYSLKNVTYGESINELKPGETASVYNCDPAELKGDVNKVLRVALRNSGDKLNLVPVKYNIEDVYVTTENFDQQLYQNLFYDKIYGGDSAEKGLLNNTGLYSQTENDLFVLEAADAPEYKTLAQGDTIRLFREENDSEVLYEKSGFATIGNAAALKDINPALYVDTAWMNRDADVNRYDYLLAVNVNRIDTTYKCDVPSHSHLFHNADTTYGRFLVNLSDSADVYDDINNIHVNRYFYNNMPRLAFKPGFHTEDKLFLTTESDTTIHAVGNKNLCIAKFAFKMVDDENFVVETAAKEVKNPAENPKGYLVWVNGNLVVATEGSTLKPEIFSLAGDERIPTANEDVNAEAGVSVVAVDGAIIVKNAAGKKVAISNILGKAIANTTIASDYETIAAPAGIAVVAVEGEEAVKVVVK